MPHSTTSLAWTASLALPPRPSSLAPSRAASSPKPAASPRGRRRVADVPDTSCGRPGVPARRSPRAPDTNAPSPRVGRAERDLAALAAALTAACAAHGLPAPPTAMPTRGALRAVDPTLANRIEALPGRNGWRRLAVYVGVEAAPVTRRQRGAREVLRQWDDPTNVLDALREHQAHPRVLPCVSKLPSTLREAVRRQGGSGNLSRKTGMLVDCEWRRALRFAEFLKELAAVSLCEDRAGLSLAEKVEIESSGNGLPFPCTAILRETGLYVGLQRYGGRRALGARLGFARGPSGIFMGAFSVSFAADLLAYAADVAEMGEEGTVAMPGIARMESDGRGDLAALSLRFGGVSEVGRRLGLVPPLGSRPQYSETNTDWLERETVKVGRRGLGL